MFVCKEHLNRSDVMKPVMRFEALMVNIKIII
jgi:hypothetical protein